MSTTHPLSRRAALALCLLLTPVAASAQTVTAPPLDGTAMRKALTPTWGAPGKPMPADAAHLDSLVHDKAYGPLTERLQGARTASAISLDLNWEQDQVFDGGGYLLAYAYVFDLWRLGAALPAPQGEKTKQSAAMMLLYTLDLVALDGPKCADPTAPSRRRDQILTQNQPLIRYLQSLPRETRMTLGSASLAVEAATAPFRTNDDMLCSGGMAEIRHDMEVQGDKPLAKAPTTGASAGKAYVLPSAPGYRPQFLAPSVWGPKQAALRPTLAGGLTTLLSNPGDTTTPAVPPPPTAPSKP